MLSDGPGGDRYYARQFGSLAVVTLDQYRSSYTAGSAQYTWLEETLAALAADPGVRFIVVQFHHGPYSSGASHGSNLTVRSDLVPLFETYGVDLVFAGHDHIYERGTVNGVKYVVTGGGGAPLYSVAGDWWTEALASAYHYCVLEIDGATLHFAALRADDGAVIDEFWLGAAVNECSTAADCAAQPQGTCTPPDEGAWACVASACIWNCTAATPPQADGGVTPDGGLPPGADGGSVAGDAGWPGDAGWAGDAGGPRPDGGGAGGADLGGGCGCRLAGTRASALGLAALLLLGFAGRRRGYANGRSASRPKRRA